MIDEWCERQVDRLCAFVPAYLGPRLICFSATRIGWRICLLAGTFFRRIGGAFSRIQWIEKPPEESPVLEIPEESDPEFARLTPEMQEEIRQWERERLEKEEQAKAQKQKNRTPKERLSLWWAGRHERAWRREQRFAAHCQAVDERAQRRMVKLLPLLLPVQRSRFGAMLLLTIFSVLGVLATEGGSMAYMAAACCVMWLSVSCEIEYEPVCGPLRQRHLAATLLRAGGFALLLPVFFGSYVGQGVQNNVVLQGAMLTMLFAHLALFFALVAFNHRQPLFLRALAGVCGVLPALTVASSFALATSMLARPFPLPAAGLLGLAGAALAFLSDRVKTLRELGGIRLRYDAIWIGVFTELGFFLMILGTWLANLPA